MKGLLTSFAVGLLPFGLLFAGQNEVEMQFRPLVLAEGERRPFGGQHLLAVQPVAAQGRTGMDLYGGGTLFGSSPRLFRYLGEERGVPLYSEGEVLAVPPEGYRDVGGGKFLFDVDGDGVEDRLAVKTTPTRQSQYGAEEPFPFNGKPFDGKESPLAGAGRGYDISGNWIADRTKLCEVTWAKGKWTKTGELKFGKPRNIYAERAGYPLFWKCLYGIQAIAAERFGKECWLILHGNVDELLAVPLKLEGGELIAGEARQMLKSGRAMEDNYSVQRLFFMPGTGKGMKRLFASSNPGVISIYEGTMPGDFRSCGYARQAGGAVAAQTLTAPDRADFTGDGIPDLITGDASGYLLLWPGTKDPFAYREPRNFTVAGKAVHETAGPSGSVQGPQERRWGYLKPTVVKWGNETAIVTCNIRGELKLYRRDTKDGATALLSPIRFTYEGRSFRCAQRSRAAQAPRGFGGTKHDALVLMDYDGELALAEAVKDGGTEFARVTKLVGKEGSAMHFCGPCGGWGRGHVALADWDGDGRTDLFFSTAGKWFREFEPPGSRPHPATVRYYRNLGTEAEPRFGDGENLELKDGRRFVFGGHNATATFVDFDGDGDRDMIVGAENGRVYAFKHEEFKLK